MTDPHTHIDAIWKALHDGLNKNYMFPSAFSVARQKQITFNPDDLIGSDPDVGPNRDIIKDPLKPALIYCKSTDGVFVMTRTQEGYDAPRVSVLEVTSENLSDEIIRASELRRKGALFVNDFPIGALSDLLRVAHDKGILMGGSDTTIEKIDNAAANAIRQSMKAFADATYHKPANG